MIAFKCPLCGGSEICHVERVEAIRLVLGVNDDGKVVVQAESRINDETSDLWMFLCNECLGTWNQPGTEIEYE